MRCIIALYSLLLYSIYSMYYTVYPCSNLCYKMFKSLPQNVQIYATKYSNLRYEMFKSLPQR